MKKPEFIRTVAEKTGLHQIAVGDVLSGIIETVKEELDMAGESKIPGVCRIKTKTRSARFARNPRTGEQVEVPEKTVVTIKAVKGLY